MSAFLRTVRFGLLTAAIAAVWALIPAASASAAGPNAVRNLAGCGTNTLAANDDESTPQVNIGFNANFFGTTYSQLYVNNNGNVTFDNPLGDYTPFDFTTTGDVMIAPFLADVDTSGAPDDGSKEVTYGTDMLGGKQVFCVNWVDVGYFSGHVDKTNSFQLLLIDQGSGRLRHRVQLRPRNLGDRRRQRRGERLWRYTGGGGLVQRRRRPEPCVRARRLLPERRAD